MDSCLKYGHEYKILYTWSTKKRYHTQQYRFRMVNSTADTALCIDNVCHKHCTNNWIYVQCGMKVDVLIDGQKIMVSLTKHIVLLYIYIYIVLDNSIEHLQSNLEVLQSKPMYGCYCFRSIYLFVTGVCVCVRSKFVFNLLAYKPSEITTYRSKSRTEVICDIDIW